MNRRILCSVGKVLLLLIPGVGHTQSVEQLRHCTELVNRGSQLLDGEQTISIMAAYNKGGFSLASEDLKNEWVRKIEALEREKSTYDLEALKKEQLRDILKNERQVIADCSDIVSKHSRAGSLYTIGRVLFGAGPSR